MNSTLHHPERRRRIGIGLLVLVAAVWMPAHADSDQHAPFAAAAPRSSVLSYPTGYSERWLDDRTFVHGPDLLDFDLDAYLARSAPHLRPHAEFMKHWSGYYSINPKVLLAVLEHRSRAVSQRDAVADDPSAGLVPGVGFREQVHEILSALYHDFYAHRLQSDDKQLNAATYALMNLFRSRASVAEFAPDAEVTRRGFLDTYERLFPGSRTRALPLDEGVEAVPPPDLLQLPWKLGQSWRFNGVHTTTGSDPGVMSSIDMTRTWSLVWGNDTSTDYVVAAHAGQVTVYSSCFVRVTSPSGWATNYYHLSTLAVSNGQQVTANQTLGVYANTQAQALCQGGSSTGPHVHFSLLQNGAYAPIDGAMLSGYTVHSGRYSYDSDPAFMWLEKGGVKYFAYNNSITSSQPATPPSATINDVRVFEGNSGTRAARFTISLSAPVQSTVTMNYATANGTATTTGVTTTLSNNNPISIPELGTATPYPSTISFGSGLGSIAGVSVTLNGLSHSYLRDVDVLLVGPAGQSAMLMSDTGGGNTVSALNLTFADSGPSLSTGSPATGTYRPTNLEDDEGDDVFGAPAPAAPYGATLSVFNGTNPAGTWRLFVRDDCCTDGGGISGGWSLSISTAGSGDYVPASGTLQIPAGSPSNFVDVTLNGDAGVETSETFSLNLSAPSGATLADSVGQGTILNDDFTDPSLAGVRIKTLHILELRALINELRARRALPAFTFTGTLSAGITVVGATHITELRTALNAVYTAATLAVPSYTHTITASSTRIRAVDVSEIRTHAVNAP